MNTNWQEFSAAIGNLKEAFKTLEARAVWVKIVAAGVYGPNSEYATGELRGFTEDGATFTYLSWPGRWGGSDEYDDFTISWELMTLEEAELIAHFTSQKQEQEAAKRLAEEEAKRRRDEMHERAEREQLTRLKAKYEPEVK